MPVTVHNRTVFRDGGRVAIRRTVDATRRWAAGVGRFLRDLWREEVPTATGTYERTIRYETRLRASGVEIHVGSTLPDATVAAIEYGRRPGKRPPAGPGSHLARWAAVKGRNPYAVATNIAKHGTDGIGAYERASRRGEGLIRTREIPRLQASVVGGLNRG